MDSTGIYGEHGLDVYDDASSNIKRTRDQSFMQKPEGGWNHDERAMKAGRGIFYKFDVRWIGSCILGQSIREFDADQQSKLLRAVIAHVDDPETYPPNVNLTSVSYRLGEVTSANVNVMLAISSQGIMVAPPGYQGGNDSVGIINSVPMRLISIAAGGENEYYNYIVYVGKDPNSKIREAFVFNCGDAADEILHTFGEAFVLFQEESANLKAKKIQKKFDGPVTITTSGVQKTDETFAMPTGHEAIYDTAANNMPTIIDDENEKIEAIYDIGSNPMVADIVKNQDGEVDDISEELMNLMKSEAKCQYTDSGANNVQIDPSRLVGKLNEKEANKEGEWVHFEAPKDMAYASLEEIQRMQAQQ